MATSTTAVFPSEIFRRCSAQIGLSWRSLPMGWMDSRYPPRSSKWRPSASLHFLDAQPRGPYLLGGHCNGALVAFETARLLVKAGHTVDLLVMIDPVTLSYWRYIRPVLSAQRFARRTVGLYADRDANSTFVVLVRNCDSSRQTTELVGYRFAGRNHCPNSGKRSDGVCG